MKKVSGCRVHCRHESQTQLRLTGVYLTIIASASSPHPAQIQRHSNSLVQPSEPLVDVASVSAHCKHCKHLPCTGVLSGAWSHSPSIRTRTPGCDRLSTLTSASAVAGDDACAVKAGVRMHSYSSSMIQGSHLKFEDRSLHMSSWAHSHVPPHPPCPLESAARPSSTLLSSAAADA